MPSYVIRITASYDFLKSLFEDDELGLNTGQAVVVYEHDASRKHIHLAIKDTPLGIDALKLRITKKGYHFPRGDWSFKNWDLSVQYLVYMTKGKLSPCFIRGWTIEQSEEWKSRWTEPLQEADRWTALYSKFESSLQIDPLVIDPMIDATTQTLDQMKEKYMDIVSKRIRRWCFNNNNRQYTPKCRIEFQYLVATYAMRNNLETKNIRF